MIQKSCQLNFSYTATAKRFITYIYHMSCFILIYFDKFTHFDRWFLCRQSKFVTRLILWRYRINCMKKTKVSTKYLQVRRGAQHCSLYLLSEYIGSQFLVIGYFWLNCQHLWPCLSTVGAPCLVTAIKIKHGKRYKRFQWQYSWNSHSPCIKT